MLYDLHVHSNVSDGTSSPQSLIDEAIAIGLSGIAITDHDTTEGLQLAEDYLKTLDSLLEFIPGIELNTELDGNEVHILGYYIDYKYTPLNERLLDIREQRQQRAKNMVIKLNELGVMIDYSDVVKQAGTDLIARPHVAMAMQKAGYVTNMQDAFAQYIGRGKPAYVNRYKFTPQEAIQLIEQAGGIPILAHPGLISKKDLLPGIIGMGVVGIEVYYPEHTDEQIKDFLQLAVEHHLLISGGSDYHGLNQNESRSKLGAAGINSELISALKIYKTNKITNK